MVHSILLLGAVTLTLAVATLALGAVVDLSAELVSNGLREGVEVNRKLLLSTERGLVLALYDVSHEPTALLNERDHDGWDGSLYDAIEKPWLFATRSQ